MAPVVRQKRSGRLSPAEAGRVVVADRCRDTVESTAWLLRHWGYDVRGAGTGPEVLEAADAYAPDAIVMEVALPGLSGWEVAARLRRGGDDRPVLLALTGHAGPAARARAREAGFDGYLLKPADPEALRGWLAQVRQR